MQQDCETVRKGRDDAASAQEHRLPGMAPPMGGNTARKGRTAWNCLAYAVG